jgi:hypothetical protein
MRVNPQIRTIRSPYADGEEFAAVPALRLDAALVHMNRADTRGNGQYLGPDPYFDDLFCRAADRAFMSCERIVPTGDLLAAGPVQSLLINRSMVHGVTETPNGAHFTSCVPDYGRDEAFQAAYVAASASRELWQEFHATFLAGNEADYQAAVAKFRADEAERQPSAGVPSWRPVQRCGVVPRPRSRRSRRSAWSPARRRGTAMARSWPARWASSPRSGLGWRSSRSSRTCC